MNLKTISPSSQLTYLSKAYLVMALAAYAVRSDTFTHDTNANLTSNFLTSKERAVIRKSDRKAEQVLGVTLTRDVSAFEPLPTANSFGLLMATIGAKRSRSRQHSNNTFIGTLKDLGVRMTGLDRMTATYGHGRKKQRCTNETDSHHQRVVLSSRAGSTGSLEQRYFSPATSEEDYDDDYEDGSDVDVEYRTELRRASLGVPRALAPPPLPSMRYAIQDEVPTTSRSRCSLSPLITDDMSRSFSNDFRRSYSFDPSPKRCSFIPSFRRDDASETCSSPDSEQLIPQAEDFQWDFPDPFHAPTTDPTYTFVMSQYAKMHRSQICRRRRRRPLHWSMRTRASLAVNSGRL
ncbi:hypothetical protein EDC04DRAFT_2761948 [Pisolithus marmoratus]|nr:hypothetical protein EDC04DRAFT_2761948 [Pisolithus marmoratus]